MRQPAQGFTRHWITVTAVVRSAGFEQDTSINTRVGLQLQALFFKEYGHQPPKENAPKTNGPGVHCFAHYPPDYRDRIVKLLEAEHAFKARQGQLF